MAERGLLSVWDYVILGLTLALSIGIGLGYGFCRGGQRNTREFLSANRQLGVFSTAISICVSFINAIMVMGASSEMVFYGTSFALSSSGMLLSAFVSQIFVTLFYPLGITSAYEYLEMRYKSRAVRKIGVALFLIQEIFFMGFASFAPATALQAVSGIPVWITIILNCLVATFYTALGGIKAVIWTDVIQCVVMLGGLAAIVIQGMLSVGGFLEVWHLNEIWGRIDFSNFDPDPRVRHTVWSLVVGSVGGWSGRFSVGQASVQRFCNVPSILQARCTIVISAFVAVLLQGLTLLAGITVFAHYASKGCNPLSDKKISTPNQILPYYVVDMLNYPGVPGLFVSVLFSGALSTISSGLSAMAAVVWKDILSENIGRKMTETHRTRLTKALVVIFGAVTVGTGFLAQSLGGQILQGAISVSSAFAGPIFGLFLLSALFPCANWKGACISPLVACAFVIWIAIGANVTNVRPKLLPLPTSNCSNPASAFNVTGAFVSPNVSFPSSTLHMTSGYVTAIGMTSSTPIPTPGGNETLQGLANLYHVSYMWYATIGVVSVLAVGLIVSALTGCNKEGTVDPNHVVSVFDLLSCCLPESLMTRCRRSNPDKKKPPPDCNDTHVSRVREASDLLKVLLDVISQVGVTK